VKIRERGPARVVIEILAFLDRNLWWFVSLTAVALIVLVFGPRQMVLAIITAAAAAVASAAVALLNWGK
jgi:hypothetical protein